MRNKKLIAAGLAGCALIGGSTSVALSATGTHSVKQTTPSATAGVAGHPFGGPMGGPGDRGGVHSVSVVLNKAGTAFISQTTDSGTLQSVDASASTITIVEGTKTVTYATPTLTIPSGATVLLDGKSSSIASLVAGDRVTVSSSSDGTTVFAIDSSFMPQGPGGPGGAHWGPPPTEAASAARRK
jgi:hypothetical protein